MTITAATLFSVLSFIGTIVLSLVVYSFKTSIRVAILEAAREAAREYATKQELRETEARLDEKISLKDTVLGVYGKTKGSA